MAISKAEQGGRRWLLVYVRAGLLGGCLDDWLPGQCAKRLVGLRCVRPSRAAASLQLGRPGNPYACFAQAETGQTVSRPARQRFGVELSEPLNTGWSKKHRPLFSGARPLAWGARGRVFESLRPDHLFLSKIRHLSHFLEVDFLCPKSDPLFRAHIEHMGIQGTNW